MRRGLFVGITIVLMLAAAELLAQLSLLLIDTSKWADTQERMSKAAIDDREYGEILHPYVGILYDPLSNPGFQVQGETVPVNWLGFTGAADPVTTRSPDRFIVGLVGGSFAWGLGLEAGRELRRCLQEDPRLAGREIVLVNLALAGFKQPQQLMACNYVLALGGEFDVVLNLDGFNELALAWENYTAQINTFYPKAWSLRAHDVPDPRVLTDSYRVYELRSRRQRLARSLKSSWFRWSALRQIVWRIQDLQCSRELMALSTALSRHRGKYGPSFASAGPREPEMTSEEIFQRCAGLWRRCSQQLHDLTAPRGTLYLHFLQPNQYLPGSKPLTTWEQEHVIAEESDYQRSVVTGYPLLRAQGRELQQAGVRFHDLTGIFSDQPQGLYIDWCCHVSAEGYAIIARRMAQEILAAWPQAGD